MSSPPSLDCSSDLGLRERADDPAVAELQVHLETLRADVRSCSMMLVAWHRAEHVLPVSQVVLYDAWHRHWVLLAVKHVQRGMCSAQRIQYLRMHSCACAGAHSGTNVPSAGALLIEGPCATNQSGAARVQMRSKQREAQDMAKRMDLQAEMLAEAQQEAADASATVADLRKALAAARAQAARHASRNGGSADEPAASPRRTSSSNAAPSSAAASRQASSVQPPQHQAEELAAHAGHDQCRSTIQGLEATVADLKAQVVRCAWGDSGRVYLHACCVACCCHVRCSDLCSWARACDVLLLLRLCVQAVVLCSPVRLCHARRMPSALVLPQS